MVGRTWVLGFALVGCVPTMPAATFLDTTLAPKAAFDLQCPKEQLAYVNLGGSLGGHDAYGNPVVIVDHQSYILKGEVGRQQGVSGCGRRASYAYVNDAWVGSGAAEAPAPQAK
jgi:hypothetical protein